MMGASSELKENFQSIVVEYAFSTEEMFPDSVEKTEGVRHTTSEHLY